MEIKRTCVIIQANLNDVVNCFEVDVAELKLKTLHTSLRAQFDSLRKDNVAYDLKYIDDEDDLVSIVVEEDLVNALSITSSSSPMRLYLYPCVVDNLSATKPCVNDKVSGKLKRREEKEKRQAVKAEDKMKRREERMNRKEDRKGSKERDEKREARLKRREDFANISYQSLMKDDKFQWPEGIDQLNIDGNNMFYLTSSMRSLSLSRNKKKAEVVLESAADLFTSAMGGVIKHTTLIFDNTRTHKEKTYPSFSPSVSMRVISAHPGFTTSDDALVAWAQADPQLARRSIYVTSDRGLCVRLLQAGGLVVKPSTFLKFANQIVNSQRAEAIAYEAWLDQIIASLQ